MYFRCLKTMITVTQLIGGDLVLCFMKCCVVDYHFTIENTMSCLNSS